MARPLRVLEIMAQQAGYETKTFLADALNKYGNVEVTSKKLGVARSTLFAEMKRLHLKAETFTRASLLDLDGLSLTIREHCKRINNGVNPDLARIRLSIGWSAEEALYTPPFIKRGSQYDSPLATYLQESVKEADGVCRSLSWRSQRRAPEHLVMLGGRSVWVYLGCPSGKLVEASKEIMLMTHKGGCDIRVLNTRTDISNMIEELTGGKW